MDDLGYIAVVVVLVCAGAGWLLFEVIRCRRAQDDLRQTLGWYADPARWRRVSKPPNMWNVEQKPNNRSWSRSAAAIDRGRRARDRLGTEQE